MSTNTKSTSVVSTTQSPSLADLVAMKAALQAKINLARDEARLAKKSVSTLGFKVGDKVAIALGYEGHATQYKHWAGKGVGTVVIVSKTCVHVEFPGEVQRAYVNAKAVTKVEETKALPKPSKGITVAASAEMAR